MMIGRECDECKKKDKPVYPIYKAIASYKVELQRHPLTGVLEGKVDSYKCVECYKKENKK